ncbi:MAG: serine/threonine protein kinase, partial [Verrucomicrobiae bacterium]|nr:serine/threonine protein kinase [Verrucomicrobiae bacterium]
LVTVIAAGEAEGLHYFVMEFVDGETVEQRLQREGKIPPAEAVNICLKIAQGLDHAWRRAKIIHRDLKPANFFISKDREVKLGDLGVARRATNRNLRITAKGMTLGTPHYVSPEQARGLEDLDFRSDIYGLGCSLFHMVTGKVPYEGPDPASVLRQHISAPPPAILSVWPACPLPLALLVGRMLMKDRANRHQSYEALIAEMRQVHDKLTGVTPAVVPLVAPGAGTPAVVAKPPRQVSPAWIYAAAGAVVVMAALFLWSLWGSRKEPAPPPPAPAPQQVIVTAPDPKPEPEPMLTPVAEPPALKPPVVPDDPWKHAVSLLPLVDPARHTESGAWSLTGGELHSAADSTASIGIPGEPLPDEYDLRITFTRRTGQSEVGMRLLRAGRLFYWFLQAQPTNNFSGFAREIGKIDQSPALVRLLDGLENGRRYTSLVEVRQDGVRGFLDGQLLVEWKGNPDEISAVNSGNLPLGLFSEKTHTVFHRIELRTITPASAGAATNVVTTAGPDAFLKEVAALRGSAQVNRVLGRLRELNPGFSGQGDYGLVRREVKRLSFSASKVADISPLQALRDLEQLECNGAPDAKSPLSDLSPLRGLPLKSLACAHTAVKDLAPLADSPLETLDITGTPVTDLSPLAKTKLVELRCDSAVLEAKPAAEVLASLGSLQQINGQPASELLQAVARAAAIAPFVIQTTALPAEQQVARVMAKLRELNPQFDGRQTHRIEKGVVTELQFSTVGVSDLSPLRALKGLRKLIITPWVATQKGDLTDLSPLRGLPLDWLWCHNNPIKDLAPLRGMPLTVLSCSGTQVADLTPLAGMKLTVFSCSNTPVSDLQPLVGMPLTVLWCDATRVKDLSPIAQAPLREIRCDFVLNRDASVLRGIRTLTKINDETAAMFWLKASSPSR